MRILVFFATAVRHQDKKNSLSRYDPKKLSVLKSSRVKIYNLILTLEVCANARCREEI